MGLPEILLRIAKTLRPEPGRVLPTDTSMTEIPGLVPAGFLYGVEVINDNTTPMEFVVRALAVHAGMNGPDAIRAMLEIHSKGGKLIPTNSHEDAQSIVDSLLADAARHGHPLVCRVVSVQSSPNTSLERTRER